MTAKHLTKNTILHKFVFLAATVAVAIIAAFSICATTQANAQVSNSVNGYFDSWVLYGGGGNVTGEGKYDKPKLSEWNIKTSFIQYLPDDLVVMIKADTGAFEYDIYQTSAKNNNASKNIVLMCDFYRNSNLEYTIRFEQKCDQPKTWAYKDDMKMQEQYEVIPSEKGIFVISGGSAQASFSFEPIIDMNAGINIEGHVAYANDIWQPMPGAVAVYCPWNPWVWDYVPSWELSTVTDWFGNFTLEGIEEDMLPGVIRVYRFGYEVAESDPIWFVPEGIDTIYRFVEMTPAEPPVPPVPPTPPDPPVPPVPPQPDPPQPVPPTPVPPTPVDPGTNIPQTGDTAAIALAIASMLALCGASATGACAKRRRFDK